MGGAIAIINNYKWKSFVVAKTTDPMGMGIVNSIDLKMDDTRIRAVNVYFLPRGQATTGRATLHSRITRHQHQSSSPSWIKRLTSQEYLYYLTQKLINAARLKKWTVLVQGDFNRPLQSAHKPGASDIAKLMSWMATNQLTCPTHTSTSPRCRVFTHTTQAVKRNTRPLSTMPCLPHSKPQSSCRE
jgi:hypothetical protein